MIRVSPSLYSPPSPPLPYTSFFGKRGVFGSQKVGKREGLERVRGKSEGLERVEGSRSQGEAREIVQGSMNHSLRILRTYSDQSLTFFQLFRRASQ